MYAIKRKKIIILTSLIISCIVTIGLIIGCCYLFFPASKSLAQFIDCEIGSIKSIQVYDRSRNKIEDLEEHEFETFYLEIIKYNYTPDYFKPACKCISNYGVIITSENTKYEVEVDPSYIKKDGKSRGVKIDVENISKFLLSYISD